MAEFPSEHPLALITGATSGLGLALAHALLTRKGPAWTLLIASRNATDGVRAAAELNRQAGRQAAEFLRLDLGSLASVREIGASLRERALKLNALVCNAGLQFTREVRTAEGIEATFGVNHLGHFALLDEIKGMLTPDARIVVVSSGTHDPKVRTGIPAPRFVDPLFLGRPELDPLRAFERNDAMRAIMQRRYSTSKLCNLYFTYELHRRLQDGRFPAPRSIAVNAFDPGLMPGSGLARDYPLPLRMIWNHILPRALPALRWAMGGNVHTPEESAAALAELVAGETWRGVSGRYAAGYKVIQSSDESYDEAKAARLWSVSEALLAENQARASHATPDEGLAARLPLGASPPATHKA